MARRRHEFADALDVGDETHVEHAVGLVDDKDLDAVQQQLAAFGEVEQAARRGDEHVGAARDPRLLVAERNAADQQRQVELMVDAIAAERLFDLRGEFARRLEDEGRGILARARPFSSIDSIGSVKAAVLPVPVWAMPSTSRPSST